MVYKYWDSITVRLSLDRPLDPSIYVYRFFTQREDLEFSVGSKAAVWEIKDPLLTASATAPGGDYEEDSSSFHAGVISLVCCVSGTQYYGRKSGYSAQAQDGYSQGEYGGARRAYPPTSDGY